MAYSIIGSGRYRKFAVPDVILMATDMEDDLEQLLPHAIAQARISDAMLVLAHVIPPVELRLLNAKAVIPANAAEMEADAKYRLHTVAARVRTEGIRCEILVQHGSPEEVIPELVRTYRADRLLLGTHGRLRLRKLILGSVASTILRNVDVPVCAIGPHVSVQQPLKAPQRILHPVSLSMGYERSAKMALEIAQYYQAEITLLHVVNRDAQREYGYDQLIAWTRSDLEQLIPPELSLWTHSVIEVETGVAAEQILHVADQMNADLLVLGVSHNMSFWTAGTDGTAYEIIAQAKCPVLTLRHSLSPEKAESRFEDIATLGA